MLPFNVISLATSKPSYKRITNFVKRRQKLLVRLFILFTSSLILLLSRFSVMGFKAPTFQSVDNPASFMPNIFLRVINYSYVYCLNMWLLICPEWLCFDWSMGCVPLITSIDKRTLLVLLFWLAFAATLAYTFDPPRDKFLR